MFALSCLTPGTWLVLSLLAAWGPLVQAAPPVISQPAISQPAVPSEFQVPDLEAVTKQIEELLLDSSTAYGQNENKRGRALAESALALATRHQLTKFEAEALFRLGKDDGFFGRHQAAREKYERSIALFEQVGDRTRATTVSAYLGTTLSELGEHARAHQMLMRARATFRELGDVAGLALAGEALMFAMDESEEKDRLREDVIADLRAAGRKATECNVIQEWGDGLFNAGRYADAYARLTESVECFEQTTDFARTGRALVSLGRVERAHGQLEQALANYERALVLQDKVKDAPAAIQSVNAMAVTLGLLGRTEEGEAKYYEALRRARASAPHLVNIINGNLGGLYVDWGRYQEGAALIEASRAQETKNWFLTIRARQLAWAYQRLGRPAEALALANEGVERADAAWPEQRVISLQNRAAVLWDQGRLDEARRDVAEISRLVADLRSHTVPADIMRRGFGETTQLLFDLTIGIQLASKDGRAALATSEQARSRAFLDRLASRDATRTSNSAAPADAAASPVGTAPSREAPSQVAAQPAMEMGAREPTAQATMRGSAQAPTPAGPGSTTASSPKSSTTAGGATTSLLAGPSAPTAAPASVEDIQALAARFRSTWLMFWVGPTATTVWVVQPSGAVHWRRLQISATQLETLVAQSVPRGSGLDGLAAMSFASRAHLRPWRELYQKLLLPVSAYLPTTPGSRLTIVPHGPLFRLSFAALQDEQGRYLLERYELHYVPAAGVLLYTAAENRHAPTRADSALLVGDPLAAGGSSSSPRALSTGMRGMIVRGGSGSGGAQTTDGSRTNGGADGIGAAREGSATASATPASSSLPPLGWARREVLSILKLLPSQSVALVGADATETAVREGMAGRRVIHFATHGVVFNNDAAVSSSYLAVSRERTSDTSTRTATGSASATAPANATPDASADGRLTADEIDRLTLDADLVVLSACGTALGPISGDGVQGFTRAFLSAGADSVIATTWSVADRTSYQVMERFYRGWLSGQSKARALRQAQLGLLRQLRAGGLTIDGVVLHDSPWLWAGFVLVGNP